jgi:hypothetical protein
MIVEPNAKEELFDFTCIFLAEKITERIEKEGKLKGEFDSKNHKVTILNSSDLPDSLLNKILYENTVLTPFGNFGCQLQTKRNQEGNWEVLFSPSESFAKIEFDYFSDECDNDSITDSILLTSRELFKHCIEDDIPIRFGLTCQKPMHLEDRMDSFASLRCFSILSPHDWNDDTNPKEILEMEEVISENLIKIATQFLNRHEGVKGIWYREDYQKLLKDEFDIEIGEEFSTGFANKEYFEKIGIYSFRLKEGKKPSEAIKKFLQGPTVADCGNALLVCHYKNLLDIIGEEKFDQLFSMEGLRLTIGQKGITDLENPIYWLSDYTEASILQLEGIFGKRPLQLGDECYFQGVPWYGNKHPAGYGGGWNMIYVGDNDMGDQLFVGHGSEKPLTEREINQKLVELYNLERSPEDELYVTQAKKPWLYSKELNFYLKKHETISLENLTTKKREAYIPGFVAGSPKRLSAKELIRLKKSEDVRSNMCFFARKKAETIAKELFEPML